MKISIHAIARDTVFIYVSGIRGDNKFILGFIAILTKIQGFHSYILLYTAVYRMTNQNNKQNINKWQNIEV